METVPAAGNVTHTDGTLQGQSLYLNLIARMPDPAMWVDPDGLLAFANAPATELLKKEELDKPFAEIIPHKNLAAGIASAMDSGEGQRIEVEWDNGRTFNASLAPVPGFGVVVCLHDITYFKKLYEAKSQLVAVVSHDLKNPLTVAAGFSEFLAEQPNLSADANTCVRGIRSSLAKMRKLIENVLDLDHAEAGFAEGTAESDAGAVIADVIAELRPLAERKEQSLTVAVPNTLPLVAIDSVGLTQATKNLLDNAISYTQPGGRINVSADALAGRIVLKVRDNGPGIPAQSQGRLFEKFYTVGSRHTIGKEGTGLGLAIVRRIVEDAGGKVGVLSEEGKGSTFWFWLPAKHS